MNASVKLMRKLLCLAVACFGAGAAHADPLGPVVSAGRASYDPVTLTVTSATAHTQIGWQSFNLRAGEVVNFVQPNAQSVVLNQIFNPQSLDLLGGLRSNGSVLFMRSGLVTGSGVNLDLAGMISTSLRLPQMALAQTGAAPLPQPAITLESGSIFVISQDEQAVTTLDGDVFLKPGRVVELAHASMPALRVVLAAPDAESINLSRLVRGKRGNGIFAGLFRVPDTARQAAQPDAETILAASSLKEIPDRAAIERFYRYALLYAQIGGEIPHHEGGMMRVAAAPGDQVRLPAIKSRPSVLPRDIEIGAPAPPARERAATPSREPVPDASEQPKQQHQQRQQKEQKAEPPNQLALALELRPIAATVQDAAAGAMQSALSSAPLAPEVLANLEAQPIPVAMDAESAPERTTLLALAPEVLANLEAQPIPVAMDAESVPERTTLLALAPEVLANLEAQPIPVAMDAESVPERTTLLALAPDVLANLEAQPIPVALDAEPPAGRTTQVAMAPIQAIAEPQELEQVAQETQVRAEPARMEARNAAPAAVVLALAQHAESPARAEHAEIKELRIERRAPRYFTDFRGAMFFM